MYKNIVVPIAPLHAEDAEAAIKTAQTLCSKDGTITLITVLDPIPGYAANYLPPNQRENNFASTQAALEKVASNVSGNIKTQVIDEGRTARTSIIEYAEENGADLIVITSHRPGLQDYFLGSTAARVVRHATCAVHVVR